MEVEETRLDCCWPIFLDVQAAPRTLHVRFTLRSQRICVDVGWFILPVANVNIQLRGPIIRVNEGINFAIWTMALIDDD